jgi:hypothetical protein
LGIFMHQFWMLCPYDSGKRRRVSYFYRQVAGKPPAAPSGPHDCKDVHVRDRPIRLSTAEREVTQSLTITNMPQSTDHRPNNDNDDNDNRVDDATKTMVQNTPMRVAPRNNTNVDDSTKTPADITPCRHNFNDRGVVNKGEEGELCRSDVLLLLLIFCAMTTITRTNERTNKQTNKQTTNDQTN